MKNSYIKAEIVSNINLCENIYEMVLQGDISGVAGQFYMLKVAGNYLPRPISICDIRDNKLVLLYQAIGCGTRYMAGLKKGDSMDILGPLGKGFNMDVVGKFAIVGGGIGIAPLLYLLKSLNMPCDVYLGFKDSPYYIQEFEKHAQKLVLSSDNGINAPKGNIVSAFGNAKYDNVFCCGPKAMMQALEKNAKNIGNLQLSMEAHMGCGIGACLGCAVEGKEGILHVCKEGPVFSSKELKL